ncbi:hypothetical protein EJ02DRAFT_216650 [Clathrospora elynae]|uniref:Uncharacterized protein n=1 Tax=Clathrospora elynae TaxID=706981 RepID=A0A6A5T7C6_9PLEO|nr:hypothetical protein EJ02DRAFT_216650 [Clathrospora elynae]
MCIELLIKYSCGHEDHSTVSCKKRRCSQTEKLPQHRTHRCAECLLADTTRLRRERDEARNKTRDAETLSANTMSRLEAAERGIATLRQERTGHERALNEATHKARDAERGWREASDRVATLTRELAEAKRKIPTNDRIHVTVKRTYRCGHETNESWSTGNAAQEACHYQQKLSTRRDENCYDCRHQENANRDAAVARLTRTHTADEQAIRELRVRIEEVGDVEALTQERDELAERLEVIEGEAMAELREIILAGQRQSEDIDAQINVLAVELNEFMRQVDERNATTDVAILDLEERFQTILLENQELDRELARVLQQPRVDANISLRGGCLESNELGRTIGALVPNDELEAARRLEQIRVQLEVPPVNGKILMDKKKMIEQFLKDCGEPVADEAAARLSPIQEELVQEETGSSDDDVPESWADAEPGGTKRQPAASVTINKAIPTIAANEAPGQQDAASRDQQPRSTAATEDTRTSNRVREATAVNAHVPRAKPRNSNPPKW